MCDSATYLSGLPSFCSLLGRATDTSAASPSATSSAAAGTITAAAGGAAATGTTNATNAATASDTTTAADATTTTDATTISERSGRRFLPAYNHRSFVAISIAPDQPTIAHK